MKKPDLMELNSTDLTKYKNQLESMIKGIDFYNNK